MSPTPAQHRHMHALWRESGVTDRADRLALTSAIVWRDIASSSDLEPWEAESVLRYLRRLHAAGLLETRAREWLAAHREQVPS